MTERLAWRAAAVTVAIAALSFLTLYFLSARLEAGPNAAILAAVMALSMARRRARGSARGRFFELADMLVVAVGAGLVAWLLHVHLYIGALVFTAGLALSVWLRRFGGNVRLLGGILTLPFVAALVAPGAPHSALGPGVDLLLVLAAALAAFGWDWLVHALVRDEAEAEEAAPARPAEAGRLTPSDRMAAQMAVAVGAAFVLGALLFPRHWSWVVLTAFIVCSGAIGRGDAVYKGVLRLGGALLGALAAAALEYTFFPQGPSAVVMIFAALFVGLSLRDANYAWWAGAMTLVMALLNPAGADVALLAERLLAILVGAVCGMAACWFVLPIRTRSVVRRRVADTLLSLEQLAGADAAGHDEKLRTFRRCAAECERLAPPLRWYKRLMGCDEEHPAVWLEQVQVIAQHPPAKADPELVKAVRLSRKALKEDQGLTVALRKVQSVLEA
jgi:hypothetical protein